MTNGKTNEPTNHPINGKSLRRMLIVPVLLLSASIITEICNCHHAQQAIRADLNDTIMVLVRQTDNQVARQDTIRRLEQINYAMAQPLVMMADQKMPGTLFALAVMSALCMAVYRPSPQKKGEKLQSPLTINTSVHLTPMQRRFVEMLVAAPDHCVPKQQLCVALWGAKDNAEESLYTLVRRTKQALADAGVEIVCNRGESYGLIWPEFRKS